MKGHAFLAVLLMAATGTSLAEDASCSLKVTIEPGVALQPNSPFPSPTIVVQNTGSKSVLLVEPGDGSLLAWRTPIITWSIQSVGATATQWQAPEGRCANINALQASELFSLGPGESRTLGPGAGPAVPLPPGLYRMAFAYRNDPDLEWHGMPLGKHDPAAMARVRQSSRCSGISESTLVTVK